MEVVIELGISDVADPGGSTTDTGLFKAAEVTRGAGFGSGGLAGGTGCFLEGEGDASGVLGELPSP